MKCLICNKDCKKLGVPRHIKSHGITSKEYYDKYLKKELDGKCKVCKKPTDFISISAGYKNYCSISCKNKDPDVYNAFRDNNPQKIKEIREKTKRTCKERYGNEYAIASKSVKEKISNIQKSKLKDYDGLIKTDDVCKMYGSGWYQTEVRKLLNITIIMKGRYAYISTNELPKIEQYLHSDLRHSKKEVQLKQFLESIYFEQILHNKKTIIHPYELDFYLPNLNIAIEYNGNWYHSIEKNCPIDYHLMKSLLCREKGIRLIHIYEFEDFEQQKQLLKDLILDTDNYPKNDFNKNNLIDQIPEPEIIYNEGYTIYGAGKLY